MRWQLLQARTKGQLKLRVFWHTHAYKIIFLDRDRIQTKLYCHFAAAIINISSPRPLKASCLHELIHFVFYPKVSTVYSGFSALKLSSVPVRVESCSLQRCKLYLQAHLVVYVWLNLFVCVGK
jgi:hypothetical protein